MAHATVRAEVDQTLDRQLDFTTEVAFDRELRNGVADAFEFSVGEILHLLGIGDFARIENHAGARAADAVNGGQADFGVLLRRNVDTGDTSHCVTSLALTLLVTRVTADHADNALALDDLAVAAHLFD